MPDKPKCPQCGRRKSVQPIGSDGDYFKCGGCGAFFDSDPEEGGSHYNDPTKRLERAEGRRTR